VSDHSVASPKSDGIPDAPLYPADLATALQSELAALADIETDYAAKRQRLETWAGAPKMKDRLVREMEARHRRERQPHVLRLGELYERIVALTMFKGLRTRH
jgi:hypothetical protein